MTSKFGQGDTVRVLGGRHAGRLGAIYDGIKQAHWMARDEGGRPIYRVYFDLANDAAWFGEDELELVIAMPEPVFRTGDRVRVRLSASWARGEAGTVNAGAWDESLTPRIARRPAGPTRVQMVHLDRRRPDAAGQGSYVAGEFDEAELEPLKEPPDRITAYPASRLASEAEALKQLKDNPARLRPTNRGLRRPTN
jgi:hypothetical protein